MIDSFFRSLSVCEKLSQCGMPLHFLYTALDVDSGVDVSTVF
jgi:hypothetical protein